MSDPGEPREGNDAGGALEPLDAQAPPEAVGIIRARRRRVGDGVLAVAILAPSMAVFAAFFFYPLYQLVHLSIYRQDNFGRREIYVGPSQLWSTLTGDQFTSGLGITVAFVAMTVPLGIVLGTLLALAAHRRLRGIRIFQTIFSSTVASSAAVASVVFFVLINPEAGYFRNVGFFSLADPDTALRGLALTAVWQNLGLTFVIVLAGLQAVPDEIMEAAALDGFGPLRRFFRITVPLISPTLLFLVVVLVVFAFQAYAQMDILTKGGPVASTQTLLFKIVESRSGPATGTGAGLSLGLFGVTLLVTLGQFTLLERRVHYGR
jgi:sn-glycerol 3-phosphate transport system permease protein